MDEGVGLVVKPARSFSPPSYKVRRKTQSKSTPKGKTCEMLQLLRQDVLDRCFQYVGKMIASYPKRCLLVAVAILLLSVGVRDLKLRDNLRDGYTPRSSRAMEENKIYRGFLKSEGDPVMTTLLFVAKDNGSLTRVDYISEVVAQWKFVSDKFTADANGEQVMFSGFCGHYCQSNDVVDHYLQAVLSKTRDENSTFRIDFPFTTFGGITLHLERNFFDVKTKPVAAAGDATNIESIGLISMAIIAEVRDLEEFHRVGQWELKLFDYCRNYTANASTFLEMQVIGSEIVDTEMNKDSQKMALRLIIGALLMAGQLTIGVFASLYYYGYSRWAGVPLLFAMLVVPFGAIASTLGVMNMFHFRINSPLLIMPFLIMGIGVNDLLLLLQSVLQQDPDASIVSKVSKAMREVGASLFITTLTNVLTFAIGCLSPTEELTLFCIGCALAMISAYILMLYFFAPLLTVILGSCRQQHANFDTKLHSICHAFNRFYTRVVISKKTFYITVTLLSCCCAFAFYWMLGIRSKLDTAKILPLDTPIRRPNRLIEDIVWNEFYPVTVIVNHPLDMSNPHEMVRFENMIAQYESLPTCKGSDYTISWYHDYKRYALGIASENFDYDNPDQISSIASLDYSRLSGFLAHPAFKHYTSNMNNNFTESIPVRSFLMMFVYVNSTSWDDRIHIMNDWRRIGQDFPEFNVSVWNVNALFVDQMQSIKYQAFANVAATMLCMMFVCSLLIGKTVSILASVTAILSISTCVTGYAALFGLDLDPVTLCAIIVSIGMAVDFVAHPAFHYQMKTTTESHEGVERVVPLDTPALRVAHTAKKTLWPMFMSSFSTVLCVLPIVSMQNYLPLVFFKIITLVVCVGFVHGVFILPVVFAQIPLEIFEHCAWKVFSCSNSAEDDEDVERDDGIELAFIPNAKIDDNCDVHVEASSVVSTPLDELVPLHEQV